MADASQIDPATMAMYMKLAQMQGAQTGPSMTWPGQVQPRTGVAAGVSNLAQALIAAKARMNATPGTPPGAPMPPNATPTGANPGAVDPSQAAAAAGNVS